MNASRVIAVDTLFEQELKKIAPDSKPRGELWKPGQAPSQVLQWAVESVCKAGTFAIIGVYPASMMWFPLGKAMNRNLTVQAGNCNHRRYIPELLRIVRSGEIDPEKVLTKREPLMSAIRAFEAFDQRKSGWIKVELQPEAEAEQPSPAFCGAESESRPQPVLIRSFGGLDRPPQTVPSNEKHCATSGDLASSGELSVRRVGSMQVVLRPARSVTLRTARAMKRSRMHIFYSGSVQGVGFRYTVKSTAAGFEVTGTVRNLPDGRVELTAEGSREELDAFQKAIRESGLDHFIRNEDVRWSDATGEFRDFEIVR